MLIGLYDILTIYDINGGKVSVNYFCCISSDVMEVDLVLPFLFHSCRLAMLSTVKMTLMSLLP